MTEKTRRRTPRRSDARAPRSSPDSSESLEQDSRTHETASSNEGNIRRTPSSRRVGESRRRSEAGDVRAPTATRAPESEQVPVRRRPSPRRDGDVEWGPLKVSSDIADALEDMGYENPSEIQVRAIPPLMDGIDVVGQAVTGSGKTAAFGIPMCESVDPRAGFVQGLVMVPTRELAQQVAREVSSIGSKRGVKIAAVYGGEPINKQIRELENGAQIVVGTPGRIKDHMNRRTLELGRVRFAVLDEADEMLDIGFADDMEYILRRTPKSRQTALFSATIPGFILKLIRRYLDDPVWVSLVSHFSATETVKEVTQIYYDVAEQDKTDAILEVMEDFPDDAQVLVFRRMQIGVDRLARDLARRGVPARGIHGGMAQSERNRVMSDFRDGTLRILIATNVAARGLDIPTVTHVINHDMPDNVEEYVHRIGRTARMGKRGTAISFISERDYDVFEKIKEKLGADQLQRKLLRLYSERR